MKRFVTIFSLFLIIFTLFPQQEYVQAKGYWLYNTSSITLSSLENSSSSGNASRSVGNEVTKTWVISNNNGSVSPSFSGSSVNANWSGGSGYNKSFRKYYTSNASCGKRTQGCTWSYPCLGTDCRKEGSPTINIGSASVSVSGSTITWVATGGASNNKGVSSITTTVTASNGGEESLVRSVGSTGIPDQYLGMETTRPSPTNGESWHNCSADGNAWAKVKAKPGKTATASTTCNYNEYWWNYLGSVPVSYAVTEKVYDYTATIGYEYRVWIPNSPPNAGFIFENSTYYEGDTLKVVSTATDPDGDPLTYQYTITDPNGKNLNFNTANFTYPVQLIPGTYTVRQVVYDTSSASDSITKSTNVGVLEIVGMVDHTSLWKDFHNNHNHPPELYYSGERFVLSSIVTNHPIESVNVQFVGKQIDGNEMKINQFLTSMPHPLYKGELYDPKMSNASTKLANGNVHFLFTAKWKNGISKQDLVSVEILDDVYKAYNYHRTN